MLRHAVYKTKAEMEFRDAYQIDFKSHISGYSEITWMNSKRAQEEIDRILDEYRKGNSQKANSKT